MQKKLISLLICGIIVFSSKAQGGLFENWAVGINAGLYGGGLQVATSLTPNLKLRGGFDFMSFTYNDAIDFDAPIMLDINTSIPAPQKDFEGELNDAKLKFGNAKVLVDFYPMKNGVFCLTGGFYLGNNKITANGMINNYNEIVTELQNNGYTGPLYFEFEDVVIKPGADGSFDAKLKMGNAIKPYIGIGLGRTIANSRVGFKFELGAVYQGKYTIDSSNVNDAGLQRVNDLAADVDLPFSKSWLNWWPMMNFAISYRIK